MNRRRSSSFSYRRAFTLMEVIAAILLSAVLVAVMLPLVGAGLTGNAPTAQQVQRTYALRSHMDSWIHRFLTEFADDLPGLRAAILDGAGQGEDPYIVTRADWIGFNGEGHETVSIEPTGLLLVTLAGEEGNTLTFLFSE